MDRVFIENLQVDGIIGLHGWERQVRQTLLLDIELAVEAGKTQEDIRRTVDYEAVAGRAAEFVIGGEYRLLETLASDLAATLEKEFKVAWLRLRIRKPGALTQTAGVSGGVAGVIVERGKERGSKPR